MDEKFTELFHDGSGYKGYESVTDDKERLSVKNCETNQEHCGTTNDDSKAEIKNVPSDIASRKNSFYVGQRFENVQDLFQLKKAYEDANFCELIKKDSRTLKRAKKLAPRRVANANPSLQFYYIHFCCKFGGRPNMLKERKRKTRSFRQDCPVEVFVFLSSDGQALEIFRLNEGHNHSLTKELYDHLPRQRAVPKEVRNEIKDALNLKANCKLIQQKVESGYGKKITRKDIYNIKQRTKMELKQNDLNLVLDVLKSENGSTTEVIIDDNKNFKGLIYQDEYMRSVYSKYPEVIVVDATYKLLELRMPIYLLLVVDGDGSSEIACVFILAEETQSIIESAVTSFKKFNPAWKETVVVMADKDFTERDAFKSCFPEASLNICLYHTLRSFRKEITCDKLGITSAERLRSLEIIYKMAYARSAKEFERQLDALHSTKLKSVIDCVELNWIPIKDQWVACFKDEAFHLGETTNNQLESTFSKIKSVCSRYTSLMLFFHEFFPVLKSLRNERNHHYLMAVARRPVDYNNCEPGVKQYSQLLTPYAFNHIRSQIDVAKIASSSNYRRKSGDNFEVSTSGDKLTTTPLLCTCSFNSRMGLPCRHIFKVRNILNLPEFESSLCKSRWTMDYLKEFRGSRFHQDESISFEEPTEFVIVAEKKTVLSQAQKFRKAMSIAQPLASLAREGGMKSFNSRIGLLKKILDNWLLGQEVYISLQDSRKLEHGMECGKQLKEPKLECQVEGKEEQINNKEQTETTVIQVHKESASTSRENQQVINVGRGVKEEQEELWLEDKTREVTEQQMNNQQELTDQSYHGEGEKCVQREDEAKVRANMRRKKGGKWEKEQDMTKSHTDVQNETEPSVEDDATVKEVKKSYPKKREREKDITDQSREAEKSKQCPLDEKDEMERKRKKREIKKGKKEQVITEAYCNQEEEVHKEENDEKLEVQTNTKEAHLDEAGNPNVHQVMSTNHSQFNDIKMPPKMSRRGRPKGAEVTVKGITKSEKRKGDSMPLLPFIKMKPLDKERAILECITNSTLKVAEALNGTGLLDVDDVETNIQVIPDTVRDEQYIDIYRVERYFNTEAWLKVLEVLKKKKECSWVCKTCNKTIKDGQEESLACDCCLNWYHFLCTSLTTIPKSRNWFCTCCKSKFS